MRFHLPLRLLAVLTATLMAMLCALSLCVPLTALAASEDESIPPASPAFIFNVDKGNPPALTGISGSLLTVCRDVYLPRGESLTLGGWLATDRGITGYRFLWVPSGGDYAEWQTVSPEHCGIGHRDDLTHANVPYPDGHRTAGFNLTIPTPEGLTDGYYDVYLRAVDGAGATCDVLALLHLRYGNADADDGTTRTVSYERLAAEATTDPSVLQNGAELRAEGLYLPDGGAVRLGSLDMAGFSSLVLEYRTASGEPLATDDRRAILGLKSSDEHPFRTEGVAGYNLTDTLVYALPTGASGTLVSDLADCTATGEVWLTGTVEEPVIIEKISFVYNGGGSDRVAARISLSETLLPQFSGANKVQLSGIRDSSLGDVLRIEVTEDTNDPFVHFHAEQVLETAGISLSADSYKYMVVLARAMAHNHGRHSTFYLCAGMITGATGECTHTFFAEPDGEWHYYLLDLTEVEHWKGTIHGWRFDIINGNCLAGDAVDFASVQFFRTREAAEAAASRPVSEARPYRIGDPTVFLDMVEEEQNLGTLAPEETYVVTAPDTAPPLTPDTEPESAPAEVETLPESDRELESVRQPEATAAPASPTGSDTADTSAREGGCGSVISLVALLLPCAACLLCRREKDPEKTFRR